MNHFHRENALFYPQFSTVPENCKGYALPHSGIAYTGIGLYAEDSPDSVNISSELLGMSLKEPLKKNHCYYGESE